MGHHGDRYPVRGREPCPAESAHWWGGHAAYYGQVGPRLVGMVRLTSGLPLGTIKVAGPSFGHFLRSVRGAPVWLTVVQLNTEWLRVFSRGVVGSAKHL